MKCKGCNKEIGFRKEHCFVSDCDAVYCKDCARSKLQKCNTCGKKYCLNHINKHTIEGICVHGKEPEEDEEELTFSTDDESEDEEDLDLDDIIEYSKGSKYAVIDSGNNYETVHCLTAMEYLENKGYSFLILIDNKQIVMVKNAINTKSK